MLGGVQEVDWVIVLYFCRESEVGVYGIKVRQDGLNVSSSGVIDYEYVVNISKVVCQIHNSPTSNIAKHLNEHNHSLGTIDTTMQVLQHQRKGTHLNSLERFHIHSEADHDNHLNDDHTVHPNKIFDTIMKIQENPHHQTT